jgi:hypothetical protein
VSALIELQEPGDIVWTMGGDGKVRAWVVHLDGHLNELPPEEVLRG